MVIHHRKGGTWRVGEEAYLAFDEPKAESFQKFVEVLRLGELEFADCVISHGYRWCVSWVGESGRVKQEDCKKSLKEGVKREREKRTRGERERRVRSREDGRRPFIRGKSRWAGTGDALTSHRLTSTHSLLHSHSHPQPQPPRLP